MPSATKDNAACASAASVGILVPLVNGRPSIVSKLATTCANFSISIFLILFTCCIVALNAPAAVAISLGNIPSRYDPNPSDKICKLTGIIVLAVVELLKIVVETVLVLAVTLNASPVVLVPGFPKE